MTSHAPSPTASCVMSSVHSPSRSRMTSDRLSPEPDNTKVVGRPKPSRQGTSSPLPARPYVLVLYSHNTELWSRLLFVCRDKSIERQPAWYSWQKAAGCEGDQLQARHRPFNFPVRVPSQFSVPKQGSADGTPEDDSPPRSPRGEVSLQVKSHRFLLAAWLCVLVLEASP
jgi:hypothetical protein